MGDGHNPVVAKPPYYLSLFPAVRPLITSWRKHSVAHITMGLYDDKARADKRVEEGDYDYGQEPQDGIWHPSLDTNDFVPPPPRTAWPPSMPWPRISNDPTVEKVRYYNTQ